jgi:RNA polymerase sigma factor (sigma-70 family)
VSERVRPSKSDLESNLEREYRLHRQPVFAMLNSEFPGLVLEHDEIYQEAWTELLEISARGDPIRHVRGLLKTLAARRAADLVRRQRPEAIDPDELLLSEEFDTAPDVDERAQVRLDADVLHMIIDTLDDRQAAVLKLRFDCGLTGPEIQKLLGLSTKRLEKIMGRAYKAVLEQVEPDSTGESRWTRRQRSLLVACETGIATAAQRARAQDMIDRDPRCRAMLHAMRTTMRDVAVVLPMPPATVETLERRGPVGAVLDHAERALGALRSVGHEPLVARVTGSPSVEQAGSGILGGLGAGAAAKGLALCLAIGGTAAVCVESLAPNESARPRATVKARPKLKAAPTPIVTRVVSQPSPPQSRVLARSSPSSASAQKRTTSQRAQEERPVSSPAATTPASPAPVGASEFGPGSIGSSSAPPAPAVAPTNGGGEFTP